MNFDKLVVTLLLEQFDKFKKVKAGRLKYSSFSEKILQVGTKRLISHDVNMFFLFSR